MQNIKKHITFKIATLLLVAALITPSATKLAHAFTHQHHKHDYCKGEKKTHLHELDSDCEFFNFKLTKVFLFEFKYPELVTTLQYYSTPELAYKFLNNHQPLSFSLRGPPLAV